MTLLFADIFTITGALVFLGFGIVYFYKSRSVKNHCSTIQKNLEELDGHSKILMFALMRGAGGGAVAVAVIVIWLQLEYVRKPEPWIPLAILIVCALFFLSSVNAMLLVKRNTTVKPPVLLLTLAALFIIVGYFFNIRITL
jgi:hypothetical protein